MSDRKRAEEAWRAGTLKCQHRAAGPRPRVNNQFAPDGDFSGDLGNFPHHVRGVDRVRDASSGRFLNTAPNCISMFKTRTVARSIATSALSGTCVAWPHAKCRKSRGDWHL